MDIRSAPVFQRSDQLIEVVVQAMELLRAFPDHKQAPEWRKELARAKKSGPAVYAMAQLVMLEEYHGNDPLRAEASAKRLADNALRADPASCPRCRGVGVLAFHGKTVACGCPLAEARARGVSLEQDAIDRGIEDRPPDPAAGTQLGLL